MRTKSVFINLFIILIITFFCSSKIVGQENPVKYTNLLIGTDTFKGPSKGQAYKYSGNNTSDPKSWTYYGSVVPGPRTPHKGKVFVSPSPITSFKGWIHARGSSYRHSDSTIMGFAQLSNQYSKYANISFMPTTGKLKTISGSLDHPRQGYRSGKDFNSEIAKPHYYKVLLKDYNVEVELTTADNATFQRYTFPQADKARILIDLSLSHDSVRNAHLNIEDSLHVSGWQKSGGDNDALNGNDNDYTVYFYAEFSKPFADYGIWKKADVNPENREGHGQTIGGYFEYHTSAGEKIEVKVGISRKSILDAKMKLYNEIPGWDFSKVSTDTKNKWNNLLSRIQVKGGTKDQKTLFYTSLVRTFDSFSMPDGLIRLLIQPKRFKTSAGASDWRFMSGGFWGTGPAPSMLGFYRRGVTNINLESAYEAILHPANWRRRRDYNKWGYVPYIKYNTARARAMYTDVVNRTLGYAYSDYCMAQIAKLLGKDHGYKYLIKSSKNYRNLFDSKTGFFRPKDPSGEWVQKQFDPTQVYAHHFYREGNAWQWLWYVPHNIDDLIRLLGGKEAFINKLDEFFSLAYDSKTAPDVGEETVTYNGKNYKGTGLIDVTGMVGQYTQGNEADRYVPYYYNYVGQSWKTQKTVRDIMDNLYKATPRGLSGMDDYGGLSSWYVLSAMGFYPVRPELPVYQIGSPIFKKVTIDVGNGKTVIIKAKNVSKKNKYIQSATLNGKSLKKSWFPHSAIAGGGTLMFSMGPKPNKEWGGSNPADVVSLASH